jgi:hypothetical protein
MLENNRYPAAFTPQNTSKSLPMTRAPVYRLSPVLDGLHLRIVGYGRLQGEMSN